MQTNIETVEQKVSWLMSTSEQTILPLKKFSKFLESDINVAIYGDVGVTCDSLNRTYYGIVQALGSHISVSILSAEDIKNKNWQAKTNLFVVPGGATTPMRACLGNTGMAAIKNYVQTGGKYLGLCAGAYFGCSRIEFAKGDAHLERITEDNLGFFKGTGVGPLNGNYDYHTADGLSFVPLCIEDREDLNQLAYSHGGGWFEDVEKDAAVKVLARYSQHQDCPAVLLCDSGEGKALLLGVHLEYDPLLFDADETEVSRKMQLNDDKRRLLFRYFLSELMT